MGTALKVALGTFGALAVLAGCERDPAKPSPDASEARDKGPLYDIPLPYALTPYSSRHPWLDLIYPGFRPARTQGTGCARNGLVEGTAVPCGELTLRVTGGNGPTMRLGAERAERGISPNFKVSEVDAFGFHAWWSKGSPGLVHFKREGADGFLSFACSMGLDVYGRRDGVCWVGLPLSDGNVASIYFPYRLRNDLPGIAAGLDTLLTRFHHRTSLPSGATAAP